MSMIKPIPALARRGPLALACASMLLLGACASVDPDAATGPARQWAERHAGTAVQLQATTPALPAEALAQPLTADAAVRLALQHSPALQALLAESWARQSANAAAAALPNPLLRLERAVQGDAVELTRGLSFGLLELLTLPLRQQAAQQNQAAEQLQLAQQVLLHAQATRQQWVRAVAAAQSEHHLAEAAEAAQTGAELARRLEQAGNSSRWQRLREEASAAEARGALARARHTTL
ncbi:MAG: hypothetical protein RJA44_1960, partial [Pseudomonadota bacterium]